MSHDDGWAAINLEMPPRVPRTEYSLEGHWGVLRAVTGIEVNSGSPREVKARARRELHRKWNFDFFWSTLIDSGELKARRTSMGHAVYQEGGTDFNTNIHCPFRDPEEALALDPWEVYGPRDRTELTRRFEEHYRRSREACPDGVNMTGIYTTFVSGLIDIFGWEMLLLAAGTDPERFGELGLRYASWMQQYFDALGDADVPVVMVHDDIVWTEGAFIHPDWYRKYVFPSYRSYFAPLVESGKRIAFTSDGNYTEFIDDIAGCGVHGFVMEPTTDMAYVAEKYGRTHFFIGNADTRVLLSGTRADIRAEVERCMGVGKGCPGFFMAVGNHIPPNTPVESALYYNKVYESLSRR